MKSVAVVIGVVGICVAACAAPVGYHVVNRLQLGGDGGWDALTVYAQARRMYISRGTHVMVVDLESGKLAGDIPDTPGVHGIALAPEFGRGFTSNGRSNTSTIFDLKTLKAIGSVPTGENPDAIIYDPASKCVFTFNGQGQTATVFRAATGKVVATIWLGGKPEFAEADGHGKVYVNNEDSSEVMEIDSRQMVVSERWSIKPGEGPTGIGVDALHHRVFSACGNKLMTILDVRTGRVATVPIGQGADGAGYDPATELAFSSNGEGTMTVVREARSGEFEVAETVPTQRGARTMAIDPKTHQVYMPAAMFGATPAPTAAMPRPRPTIVKDSFSVVVAGR